MAEVDKVQSLCDQSQTAPAIINSSSEGTYFLLSSFFMWAPTRSVQPLADAPTKKEKERRNTRNALPITFDLATISLSLYLLWPGQGIGGAYAWNTHHVPTQILDHFIQKE